MSSLSVRMMILVNGGAGARSTMMRRAMVPIRTVSTTTTTTAAAAAALSLSSSSWFLGGATRTTQTTTTTSISQQGGISLSPSRRTFATGTRGSRGHGWYVNYRAGKGGRHLQGEYGADRENETFQDMVAWNESIFALGQCEVALDVVMEPRTTTTNNTGSMDANNKKNRQIVLQDSYAGPVHTLRMRLASTVMEETTQNFVQLCQMDQHGYKGSLLYRIEKNVGFCGGDVLTNTGKTGRAAQVGTTTPPHARAAPLQMEVEKDPLALWHLPGTVTMMVPTVGTIDSRFVLCTQAAPHLDGIYRAFGQMTEESIQLLRTWQSTLLTYKGVPTTYDLIIVNCHVNKMLNNEKKDQSDVASMQQ